MRPITFSCTDTLALAPAEIAGRILDLANWTDFKGYAVLPGIKAAEYEARTPGVVGSRIRVTSTDGSGHVEEQKMFGCICFLINGNALAGVWKDRLIARLGPDEGEAALREPHVRAFDITGRPMRNWVVV